MTELIKLKTINRLIGVSLISQILISRPVWENSIREFPTAPVIENLSYGVFGSLMYMGLIGLLILLLIKPLNKKVILSLVLLLFLLILEDQSRLQPWVFLYSLLLICTVFRKGEKAIPTSLTTLLFILALSYFWGGCHKINYFFSTEMLPWLSEFTGQNELIRNNPIIGYAAGLIEALAGLALLFKRSRLVAVIVLVLMHVFILVSLGPLGQNWNEVVWPWNICFIILLILLLKVDTHPVFTTAYFTQSTYRNFCLIAVGFIPVLAMFGLWDHFLSGSYYSATTSESIFFYTENDRQHLPSSTTPFLYFNKGTSEEYILLDQWALGHMNVPLYPEMRTQIQVGKKLCDCIAQPELGGLRINRKNRFTGESESIEIPCSEM